MPLLFPSLVWLFLTFLATALSAAATSTQESATSDWLLRVWRSDDAPYKGIKGLAQTPEGYLWVATSDSLSRFDGMQFETFPRQEIAGADQKFHCLMTASDGSVWIGCEFGTVIRLHAGKVNVFKDQTIRSVPQSMVEDADGVTWVSYSHGEILRIQNGAMENWTKALEIPERTGVVLTVDRNKHLWFAKAGLVGMLRNGKFEVLLHMNDASMRLGTASDGGIWIFSGSRLLKYYEDGKLVPYGAFKLQNGEPHPTAVLEGHDGGVWIGCRDTGLLRYDHSRFENIPISHQTATCLLEDHDGTLWAGAGGELNRIRPRAIFAERLGPVPFNAVNFLCEDAQGNLWASSKDGALIRREDNQWKPEPVPVKLANCLASDRNGALWVGTRDHEVDRVQNRTVKSWGKTEGVTSHTITAMVASTDGKIWCAGESPIAVYCIRNGELRTIPVPPSTARICVAIEDPSGTVWFGTNTGTLLRVAGEKIIEEPLPPAQQLSIRALYATAGGSLWIGCNGQGLARWKNGKLTVLTTANGLYNSHIVQIVPDNDGWLWFDGATGIFKARQADLEAVADGQIANLQSVHYGAEEGVPDLRAGFDDQATGIRSRDGRIWMPLGLTLAVIDPKKLQEALQPPTVLIQQIATDNKPFASYHGLISEKTADIQGPGPLILPPGYRRLEFIFTALSLSALESVHFQYQLEGFDAGWVDAGLQRTASYPKLPPGTYHFKVKACSRDGIWNESGSAVQFTVGSSFWQRRPIQLASLAALGFVVGAAVRYGSIFRLRALLRQLQERSTLEQERARIARDLHDDLGSRLTRIVLLNELALHGRLQPGSIESHAAQISSALRQGIQSLDETVWALNPRNDTLRSVIHYVGQLAVEFLRSANVRCRLDLPDHPPTRRISAEARHHLLLSTKEALNNAVRHGHPKEIWLRVKIDSDLLQLTIEDDGQGFEIASQAPGADGLHNMRQRMEETGGRFEFESAVGKGTRVTLSMPLPKS